MKKNTTFNIYFISKKQQQKSLRCKYVETYL